ncbi:hypothetical protein XarzCFBP7410_06695 [Xanthomonas arboricola pv. zantedeschiae]|uniref:hypothetical protein n=1 Tax=Xanthomonas arboricola TaxID=56448 RepID=UPI000CEECC2F|nr:hypothetical protein [Xanthomonas arboricola]PPT84929.1 hypothetical protein XarzCFBP7410_06695 [Xanthomonas arboricola pv. zantedeschiae]PPU11410.1 hypothetical protein XarjCFBP1022_12125 [Xanthomonas arboricola]PPU44489.1 hypothetical protein XarbCFBP7697_00745 [Xanthomonas arboricola]
MPILLRKVVAGHARGAWVMHRVEEVALPAAGGALLPATALHADAVGIATRGGSASMACRMQTSAALV